MKRLGVFILFFLIAFFIRINFFIDHDFGWHLKNAEIFLERGMSYHDLYSYTMPSYPVVAHSWASEVFIFYIYSHFGLFMTSLIFSVLTLLILFISIGKEKFNSWPVLIVAGLSASILLPYASIRPQVLGWLMLAILLKFLFDKNSWRRHAYSIPVLFLIWTNIHGSFASGICILGIVWLTRVVKNKAINFRESATLILSFIATLVNPYGITIWKEVLDTVTSSYLRAYIGEWQPGILAFPVSFIFYLALAVAVVWKYRKLFPIEQLLVFTFLMIQGLTSTKNIPLWTSVSVPMVIQGLQELEQSVKAIKYGLERLRKVYLVLGIISICVIGVVGYLTLFDVIKKQESSYYPKLALEYLKTNSIEGEIFSNYGWGGYLIWKYPEKKVFIDGRMAVWLWKKNPEGESDQAMRDYINILSGQYHFKNQFDKYNVTTVLWPKTEEESLNKNLLEHVLLEKAAGATVSSYSFLEDLEANNWQKVYEDDVAVIYTSVRE